MSIGPDKGSHPHLKSYVRYIKGTLVIPQSEKLYPSCFLIWKKLYPPNPNLLLLTYKVHFSGGEAYLKFGYVIFGIFLVFFGFVSETEWMWPFTIGTVAIFSGIFFFVYGLYVTTDQIADGISPILRKALLTFSSIVMFGGSAFFFYSIFFAQWDVAPALSLFGGIIMFILGCQCLHLTRAPI
jgi:hypothetical protein